MSRPLSIKCPGGLYHVSSRGARREPIVEDDVDRAAWVDLLAKTVWRFNGYMHAHCLMTNHDDVLVPTPGAHQSLGMRQRNGVWSQQSNRRHGHVFKGWFKAIIVQRESCLRELARDVVLNPVRASMVSAAQAYPWGSDAATVDAEAARQLDTRGARRKFRHRAVPRRYAAMRPRAVLLPEGTADHGLRPNASVEASSCRSVTARSHADPRVIDVIEARN